MKKSITIADTLSDITLKQWQDLTAIEDPTNEQVVSLFCNISGSELLELPSHVYNKALLNAVSILEEAAKDTELTRRFWLNGIEYGMIPNLDEISYGENKDLVALLASWDTMHKAMSVLFRPIIKTRNDTYDIEPYKDIKSAEIMQEMPIEIVLGAKVFFYHLTNALLRAIPNYLTQEVQTQMQGKQQMQTQITKENGEVMMKHLHLLKETLEDLTR